MRLLVGLIAVVVCMGLSAAGEIGWRTDGSGSYPDAAPPTEFSPESGVVWAAPLPSWSNASPVVIGDRIFVCAEPDLLIAVDKETGKVLWQKANPVSTTSNPKDQESAGKLNTHPHNGFTSATPVCDGRRVFGVFGNGVVSAYDLEGKRLWSRFITQPIHKWGHCASPVLAGGLLLVHFETLVALDPATGAEKWRQPVETWESQRKKQWGTPAVTRIGDIDVVVTVMGNVVRASNGEILYHGLGKATFSTPLVADGIAYFISYPAARAVRLPADLEGMPEVLWETKTVKERFYASPLLHEGLIYTIMRPGLFQAYDAKTGEVVFQEKLQLAATVKEKNAAYTSPTLGGKLLYFAGMDGSVVLVKPGRTYEEIGRNKVEKELRSNPVFEGTRMYLRAPKTLYCFGK